MKKSTILMCIIMLLAFNIAFTQDNPTVFDWDSGTTTQPDENTIVGNKNDIEVTVTSAEKLSVIEGNNFGGTSGKVLVSGDINTGKFKNSRDQKIYDRVRKRQSKKEPLKIGHRVRFNKPMIVSKIEALDVEGEPEVFVFTPYGGENEPVMVILEPGDISVIPVDWSGVTHMTIVSYGEARKFQLYLDPCFED
ncbi:MAG TPA: hypothetical protein VKN14_14145 [Flavobacteriaceae bacterium]|nr:hypothetical protein [Flavobacteriaceae bacterium]